MLSKHILELSDQIMLHFCSVEANFVAYWSYLPVVEMCIVSRTGSSCWVPRSVMRRLHSDGGSRKVRRGSTCSSCGPGCVELPNKNTSIILRRNSQANYRIRALPCGKSDLLAPSLQSSNHFLSIPAIHEKENRCLRACFSVIEPFHIPASKSDHFGASWEAVLLHLSI